MSGHIGSGPPQPTTEEAVLVSVVTVCRNAEETIETTLSSVAEQKNSSGSVEHVVIDGASEDGTLEIVKRYPAVHWISEADDGISDAFNKGLRLSRGKYVLYLNADDYLYDEHVLYDVKTYVEEHQQPDWIVGDVVEARHDQFTVPQRRYPPSCWSLMLRNRIGHQSVFLKRRIILEVGGFDTRFKTSMDYDLFERLCARGYKPLYFPRLISVFSKEGLTSVTSPALVSETREVANRFRNNPLKRIVGRFYDQLRGDF